MQKEHSRKKEADVGAVQQDMAVKQIGGWLVPLPQPAFVAPTLIVACQSLLAVCRPVQASGCSTRHEPRAVSLAHKAGKACQGREAPGYCHSYTPRLSGVAASGRQQLYMRVR